MVCVLRVRQHVLSRADADEPEAGDVRGIRRAVTVIDGSNFRELIDFKTV